MLNLNIDSLIVVIFLLITLIIGLRTGRGIKDIREYATANKIFGTGALVLTWLATDVAGETILDMTDSVRTVGIIQPLVVFSGWGIALLMQALFFAPRFTQFSDCLTMGDIMGYLYKGPSQVMTGLLGFFTALCIAGMELTVLGLLGEHLLSIDFRLVVGLGGFLLVLYTTHGGIKAVAFTDLFQGLILCVVVPIIMVAVLKQSGGVQDVLMQVPATQLKIFDHHKASYYLALFLSLSVFQFSVIDPALVQRILMGKTKQQLRHQFFIVAACLFALMLALSLLGLASIVLYPEVIDMPIVPRIIVDILPTGLKGLAMAGLFAITMATFDSFLHAAGLTLVHDVINPFYKSRDFDELKWVRYVTVSLGLFVIGIGLVRADDLYSFVLLSYKFTGPLLAFPLFAGVCGLKPDQRAFYVASGATVITLLLTEWLLPAAQNHWVPITSVLVNGTFFLGIHAIRYNGFVIVNRTQGQEYFWKPRRQGILMQLKQWLPTPRLIIRFSQKKVTYYGASYGLFGVFCCVNYLFPYFMWEYDSIQAYDLMLYLRFLGAMLCALLIVKDQWPKGLLPYLPTFWHLTLLYCLPFTSTVMFLLTQGSVEWLINIAITIMFLIVLVDWMSFIILTSLGLTLGFLFYQLAIGPISLQLDFSTSYLLVYQAIFATLIGLLFARRKQQRFDKLATEKQVLAITDEENKGNLLAAFKEKVRLLKLLKQAGIEKLPHITRLTKTLRMQEQERAPLTALIRELDDTLTPMTVALEKLENRAMDFLQLKVETIAVDKLFAEVQEQLRTQGLHGGVRFVNHTQHQELSCDRARICQVLVQCITALKAPTDEIRSLLVGLEDTKLLYPIRSIGEDYVKQVPALCFIITTRSMLPIVEEQYAAQMNGSALLVPENAQGLLWYTHQRIIKAHYGYSNLSGDVSKDTYLYVIPVRINEVRPKDMDKPYMELGAPLARADDTYPGAKEQEEELLAAIQQRTAVNIDLVKTAIEMIKWYHGTEKRASGEPFYLHPLAVARIVLEYNQDEATLLGALLHDTVEDTPMLLENIETIFGKEVAGVVDGVTHLESNKETFYKVNLSTHENLLMLLEEEDPRVLYVKLADRMHNMRTIQTKPHKSQRKTAEETLQFFVPLASQLKLREAAEELKERCFSMLSNLQIQ